MKTYTRTLLDRIYFLEEDSVEQTSMLDHEVRDIIDVLNFADVELGVRDKKCPLKILLNRVNHGILHPKTP